MHVVKNRLGIDVLKEKINIPAYEINKTIICEPSEAVIINDTVLKDGYPESNPPIVTDFDRKYFDGMDFSSIEKENSSIILMYCNYRTGQIPPVRYEEILYSLYNLKRCLSYFNSYSGPGLWEELRKYISDDFNTSGYVSISTFPENFSHLLSMTLIFTPEFTGFHEKTITILENKRTKIRIVDIEKEKIFKYRELKFSTNKYEIPLIDLDSNYIVSRGNISKKINNDFKIGLTSYFCSDEQGNFKYIRLDGFENYNEEIENNSEIKHITKFNISKEDPTNINRKSFDFSFWKDCDSLESLCKRLESRLEEDNARGNRISIHPAIRNKPILVANEYASKSFQILKGISDLYNLELLLKDNCYYLKPFKSKIISNPSNMRQELKKIFPISLLRCRNHLAFGSEIVANPSITPVYISTIHMLRKIIDRKMKILDTQILEYKDFDYEMKNLYAIAKYIYYIRSSIGDLETEPDFIQYFKDSFVNIELKPKEGGGASGYFFIRGPNGGKMGMSVGWPSLNQRYEEPLRTTWPHDPDYVLPKIEDL